MIVGRFRNSHAIHFVGYAVIKAIGNDVEVVSSYGFVDHSLAFAAAEAGIGNIYFVCFSLIAVESNGALVLKCLILSPLNKILINLVCESFTAGHCNNAERAVRNCFYILCC